MYPIIPTLFPILSIKWTGDSKSIVVINHIAHGSEAGVYHFDGKKWDVYEACPRTSDYYEVVGEMVGKDTVKFSYVIIKRTPGNLRDRYYIYTFVFHPDTNERVDEKTKEIDEDAYSRLQFNDGEKDKNNR